MAGTWKGIGTKFYGSIDQNDDESFITTEWFVILFFPLIPLGSYRVIYGGTERGCSGSTSHYRILKKLGINWAQVLLIYFASLLSTAVAIILGWVVGNMLSEFEWGVFVAFVCAIAPILLTAHFFLEAKPSKIPEETKTRSLENFAFNIAPNRTSEIPRNKEQKFLDVDISRIPKPIISPPSVIVAPEIEFVDGLLGKYWTIINEHLDNKNNREPVIFKVKLAIDNVILVNFKSIDYFMKNEVYDNSIEKEEELIELIKRYNTLATAYAWIIGYEWGQNYSRLKLHLEETEIINIEDIPADTLQKLIDATYYAYYLFALVFNEYYESIYGKNVRYQKEGHLEDIYQGMMKGILACFIDGVRAQN